MSPTAPCRCDELTLLKDLQADHHADHLVREGVEEGGHVVWFRCPRTQRRWAMDFLGSDGQARSIRLRRSMSAAELVEYLTELGDSAERFDWTHPDIEFSIPGDPRTYRGLEQARAVAALAASDPDFPKAQPVSLIEVDERKAVVLGGVSYMRDGLPIDHRPGGWLVGLAEGQVSRSLWFDSWEAARSAGGIPKDAPIGKRIGNWTFALARAFEPAARPT